MAILESLNELEFHHVIEATPGVSLVIFTGPACGACRMLKQVLAENDFGGIRCFEVDAGSDMGLTREYDVFHLPALFLFRDGVFHSRIQAETAAEPLRRAIDAALAAPPEEAP